MTEVSKTDKVGEILIAVGEAITLLDDKFANEEGHIKLDSLEKVLDAASLLYLTIKKIYEITGKEFDIQIPGALGKIIELLLKLLDESAPKNPA